MIGVPSLSTILLVWGILAPLGTFGWVKAEAFFKQRAAVASAVRTAKADERQACNVKIGSIKEEIERDAAKQIKDAKDAVAALSPTPPDDAGLRALCDRSASCRDRRGK
jgi:hypothetical protein